MADEDLVINLAPAPQPKPREWKGNVAIGISILALVASGLQSWNAWQNRKIAEMTLAPYLEVTNAKFVSESSLFITVHNIGHSPARKLKCTDDAYVGWAGIGRSGYTKIRGPSSSYAQSVPVGKETDIGSYVPPENALSKAVAANHYQSAIVELRGQITYHDDNGRTYYLPYCYVVDGGKPLPTSHECNDAGDDILKEMFGVDNLPGQSQ